MSQETFNLIVGTLLRSALAGAAGWFAAHGLMPQGSTTEWVGAVLVFLLNILWSLYQKYLQKQIAVTAATMAPSTIPEVKAVIANKMGATFTEVVNS